MKKANQLFLFIAVICWACILGAFVYSTIAFFPPLLSHLPESSILANGLYSIKDPIFWKIIDPTTLFFSLLALISNWNIKDRRKLIGLATGTYILILIATFTFFVPELMQFYHSNQNTTVTASEWYHRGQVRLNLNLVRGLLVGFGFVLLLLAIAKNHTNKDRQ